jgi:hypothetical protein
MCVSPRIVGNDAITAQTELIAGVSVTRRVQFLTLARVSSSS